jgi:polyhydroxyalkanoate synthesis regulator phasin
MEFPCTQEKRLNIPLHEYEAMQSEIEELKERIKVYEASNEPITLSSVCPDKPKIVLMYGQYDVSRADDLVFYHTGVNISYPRFMVTSDEAVKQVEAECNNRIEEANTKYSNLVKDMDKQSELIQEICNNWEERWKDRYKFWKSYDGWTPGKFV